MPEAPNPSKAATEPEPKTRHLGRGHIPAMDGVRGLAVLGVVCSHLFGGNFANAGRLGPLIAAVLGLGVNGVALFFVLSGFLITGILRDSLGDAQYFRKFYARRVLRIFPLYYGVLLLLFALTRPLAIHWSGTLPSLLLYLQNTSLLPSLAQFGNQRYVSLDHLWSLAVEEQFYLLWPLLVFAVRSQAKLLALCAAGVAGAFTLRIVVLLHGGSFDFVNRNTLCRMDVLLAGAALALLMRSRLADRVERCGALLTVAGSAAFLCSGPLLEWLRKGRISTVDIAWLTGNSFLWIGLASFGLLAWVLQDGSVAQRVFQARALRFLGKYSYGLYVLHALPRPAWEWLLARLHQSGMSAVTSRLLVGCLGLLLSVAAAYASFHLYEKRFLRLKRFFDYAPQPSTEPMAKDGVAFSVQV